MATTKKQIQNGSENSDVKDLQKILNSKGYNLEVDGVFGSKTEAAVRDYQTKNNLQVDGIVGTNTWGSLLGSSSGSTTNKTTTTTPAATTTTKNTTTKTTTPAATGFT